MSLPKPPPAYDMEEQSVTRGLIDKMLNTKIAKGQILDALYFKDTATGVTHKVVVTSGAFVIT